MTYHVARDGELVGELNADEFRAQIFSGQILPDDHYWTEGMTDWKQVSEWHAPSPWRAAVAPDPIARNVAAMPPSQPLVLTPVPQLQVQRASPAPKSTSQRELVREAIAAIVIGALIPGFWKPFILVSFGLLTMAFVVGIMMIVRGKPVTGALLIAGSFFGAIGSIAM